MIDHTSKAVPGFEKSKALYRNALRPLGNELLMEFSTALTGTTDVAGFSEARKRDFWISRVTPERPAHRSDQATLSSGDKDNGLPGLRPHYHPNYYAGAFVLGPDDHDIEAACHMPE